MDALWHRKSEGGLTVDKHFPPICITGISTIYSIHVYVYASVVTRTHFMPLSSESNDQKNEMLLKFPISGRGIVKQF